MPIFSVSSWAAARPAEATKPSAAADTVLSKVFIIVLPSMCSRQSPSGRGPHGEPRRAGYGVVWRVQLAMRIVWLAAKVARNSDGDIFFSLRKWRLKFDRFEKPTSKQISATLASGSDSSM